METGSRETKVVRRTPKVRRLLGFVCLVLLVCMPLSLGLIFLLGRSTDRVIKQWQQPAEVNYGSFDPYCLSVIEGSRDWGKGDFPRRHYLFVGRGTAAPSYGHSCDYEFHASSEDVDAHVAQSSVEWTPQGVTLLEATGHRLFIPKKAFIGGR